MLRQPDQRSLPGGRSLCAQQKCSECPSRRSCKLSAILTQARDSSLVIRQPLTSPRPADSLTTASNPSTDLLDQIRIPSYQRDLSSELVINSSFEDWRDSSPDGWYAHNVEPESSIVVSGRFAARLGRHSSEQEKSAIGQLVRVSTGMIYRVSFFASGKSSSSPVMTAEWVKVDGTDTGTLAAQIVLPPSIRGTYVQHAKLVGPVPPRTGYLRIVIMKSGLGYYLLDDVSLSASRVGSS